MHKLTSSERRLKMLETYSEGLNRTQINHARYYDPSTPYHLLSKVFQSRHLLRPDRREKLRRLVHGVVGRAQRLYPDVRLYCLTFMSTHVHLMVQGDGVSLVRFIGYLKREVSRRWGWYIDWPGPMWEPYLATALPSAESQETCFRYILAHGVKEGIVATPQEWPGVESSSALVSGRPLTGEWLNATRYGKAQFKQRQRKSPRDIRRSDFAVEYVVRLDPLPAWALASPEAYRQWVGRVVREIIQDGECVRGGRNPLGLRAVFRIPRTTRGTVARPPWHEGRRRMVVWDSHRRPEARAYLSRYWQFQAAYLDASERFRAGDRTVAFPPGAFRPGMVEPAEPPDQLAA